MYGQEITKKPPQSDDIDDFMSKRQTAPKVKAPAVDDVDSFMESRSSSVAPAPRKGKSTFAPGPRYDHPPDGQHRGYTTNYKDDGPVVRTPEEQERDRRVAQPMAFSAPDVDATGKETGAGQVFTKPAGVAPKPRPIDPRARKAARIGRQIEQSKRQAVALFQQADKTPGFSAEGGLNPGQQLRAQAEGKLEQANMLAKNAQRDYGDHLEIGFGKDTDPNSKREWAYAKPKTRKAFEESDALAIRAGNQRRFADPGGELNQALNVTPEDKARNDRQRQREQRIQSLRGTPSLDPVSRTGARIAGLFRGASPQEMNEAIPRMADVPVVGQAEDIANRFVGSAVRGAAGIPEGLARFADRQLNRGDLAQARTMEQMLATHPEWSPEEKAATQKQIRDIYANQSAIGDTFEGLTKAGEQAARIVTPTDPNKQGSINPLNPNFYSVTLPEAAGSMAPFMAGGAAGAAAKIPTALTSGILGVGMSVPDQYRKARQLGASPEQLARAVDTGTLAGLIESLGAKSLMGEVAETGRKFIPRVLGEGAKEAGQEALQSDVSDLGAKFNERTQPNLTVKQMLTNAAEQAIPAAFLGGAGGIGSSNVAQRQAEMTRAEQPAPMNLRPTMTGPTQITKLTQTAPAASPVQAPLANESANLQPEGPQTQPLSTATPPSALPLLPAPADFNARRAKLLGMDVPPEIAINEQIQTADKLLNSADPGDQRQGRALMNRALMAIRQSEGYLNEVSQAEGEKPYTAARAAIESRLRPESKKLSTPENQTPQVSLKEPPVSVPNTAQTASAALRAEADAAKIKAAEFEQMGDFTQAAATYQASHQNLKRLRRSMGQPKTPEAVAQINQIDREISIADANRRKAVQQSRAAARQANAPTRELSKDLSKQPLKIEQAQVGVINETNNLSPNFDEIVADVDSEFTPDTGTLAEVRDFQRRKPQTEAFTEEPPTGQLARRPKAQPAEYTEYEGGQLQRYSKPLEGQPIETPETKTWSASGKPIVQWKDLPQWAKSQAYRNTVESGEIQGGTYADFAKTADQVEWHPDGTIARYGATGKLLDIPPRKYEQQDELPEVTAMREREKLPPMERQRALREAVPKGQFGQFSSASRTGATTDSSLAGNAQLRRLLGLGAMPPYHLPDAPINPKTGKPYVNPAWQEASQDTLNELARLAGKERSSQINFLPGENNSRGEMGDVYAKLIQMARRKGERISPELRAAFAETAIPKARAQQEAYERFISDERTEDFRTELTNTFAEGKQPAKALRDAFIRHAEELGLSRSQAGTLYSETANEAKARAERGGTKPPTSGKPAAALARSGSDDLGGREELRATGTEGKPATGVEIPQTQPKIQEKKNEENQDSFSVSRINPESGQSENYTFKRGEYAKAWLSGSGNSAKYTEGRIDGISHAKKQAKIVSPSAVHGGGVWHDFGTVYKAEEPFSSKPAKPKEKLSRTIEKSNAKFGAELTEADRVLKPAKPADSLAQIENDLSWGAITEAEARRRKAALKEQPKAREQKTNAPTAAQTLTDAKIQFKSGKRGQAGTLYANEPALDVIRAAYEESHGEQRYFANVNMNSVAAKKIANALTDAANDPDFDAATQRKLRTVAREFSAAAQSGETVSIVSTAEGRKFSDIKVSRRHELFHDAQEGLQNSPGFLAKHKYGDKLIEGLQHYSFEDRTTEAAAFIAGGQAKDFGLTEAQGNEFLEDYFDDIVKNNGAAALKRFFSVAPHAVKTLKQARRKYGIELQGQTGKDYGRASGESGTGRPGTQDRAGRESGSVLQAAQPGRSREQKRIRASFGSLANEPRGQVLASGLNIQGLFNRKPKPASASQPAPLPKNFNLANWSQRFYREAMARGMNAADRAKYDAAKTPKEKNAALFGATIDPKHEQAVFAVIDKADKATSAGDGSALYDAMVEATDMLAKKSPERGLRRVVDEAGNVITLPRSLMSSSDVSAPGRQGAILSLPPSQWAKTARASLRMFQAFSTKQYKQISKEINLHPDAEAGREAGLFLSTDKSGLTTAKEEDFISRWTDKIPIVKHSEQAYKTYLDSLRMDTFARYKKSIDKTKGLSAEQKESAYKAAAEWINIATGRGSLGKTFEDAMPLLSKTIFAPRYTASRIQVLNPMTYAKNARTAEGRAVLKNQMSDLVQYAGMVSATLALAAAAGADVGLDPDDADFLKIKFGNTRYDMLAGIQQPMRLFYRMGKALYGRATGEKVKSRESALDMAQRFGRSKLAPVPSFFVDYITGKDFIGRDFEMGRAVKDRVFPLMWRDFYEAYEKDGLGEAAKVLPGAVGIGVQNYNEKPGILKPSGFSKAAAEKGLKYESIRPKAGEPEAIFTQRKQRVEGWMSEYGDKLIANPRYKALSEAEQKAAIELLRDRIGRQQNLVKPRTSSLEPNAVLLGVKKSAADSPKRQSKYLYSAPK